MHRNAGRAHWGWLALASVLALALLVLFERVVRGGVAQGETRRAEVLQRSDALWRCNTLPGRQARSECRVAQR